MYFIAFLFFQRRAVVAVPRRAYRRRRVAADEPRRLGPEGAACSEAGVVVNRPAPATGSSRCRCRRSAAVLRFGFLAASPISCAKLRFKADIRSTTGLGAAAGRAFTGNPRIFASISPCSAS